MVFPCREVIFSMVFSHPRIGPTGLNVLALEAGSWHGRSSSSISRRQHRHHHHQKQQQQMQLQYSSRNSKSSSSISSRNRTPSSQQQLLKLSLSMGFRNYVRQFFAAFFCAFSVLHCHGVSVSGGLRFCSEIFTPAAQWCFLIRGLAAVAAKASAAAGGKGSQNS